MIFKKRDKEYFKDYIRNLNYTEFLSLSQAMIELSSEMQKAFAETKLSTMKNTKYNKDDPYHG